MDFNAIKVFTAVVQAGSLSAGAARLQMPVATVSRKIKELENGLNVQLLERTGRGVQPTLIGQQVYEQAHLSVETLDNIAQQVIGEQAQCAGRLRLSLPLTFEPGWLLLGDFQAAYPRIEVFVLATERKLDLLAEGIDVALRSGGLATDSLVARKFGDMRLQLVASPDLLARCGTPHRPDELAQKPCIGWSPLPEHPVRWSLGGQSIIPPAAFCCNDYRQLRQLALLGRGITDLPDFFARPLLAEGALVEVLPDFPFPQLPLHLLYIKHRHPSSVVRVFVEFCLDNAGKYLA